MDLKQSIDQASFSFNIELVLMTIIDGSLSVFLVPVDCGSDGKRMQLPSCQVNPSLDCNLDHAVKRAIMEITGNSAGYLEQVKTVGNATRKPGVWSVSTLYYGLLCASVSQLNAPGWFSLTDIQNHFTIAYDHLGLIFSCYKRLRSQAQYTSLPMYLLPSEFTVFDLQRVYETLLEVQFDNKSFRRRFFEAGLLHPLEKWRYGCNRPAQLYSVAPHHVVHHFSRKMLGSTKCV
jgi:8-oxo-dGTP diphosphatase